MNSTQRPLHSLDAWPGESAKPPLRLLETRHATRHVGHTHAARPAPAGWLQRLRQALAIG